MSTSTKIRKVKATKVSFTNDKMIVMIDDGREISVPIEWFPRLRDATQKERGSWRLIGGGVGIHWDLLDEDLSVEGLLS